MLSNLQESVQRFVSENATTLLTAGGVAGTAVTGVLAWRGGFKAGRLSHAEEVVRLKRNQELREQAGNQEGMTAVAYEPVDPPTFVDKVQAYGLHAAPPILSGTFTIASIIFSHRMTAQKAAALAAAYGLSERQLREYKDKVAEKITGPKAQAIEDELAQDRVKNTPGASQVIVVEGKVLCFDSATGRYFESSMEDIKRAEIATNQEILHHDSASASFFYEQLGLPATTWSDDVGWNSDNIVDITYSTVLAYNDRPCLTIDFKYLPRPDFLRPYTS